MKAQLSCWHAAAQGQGTIFISVNDSRKPAMVEIARKYAELGFKLVATRGTASAIKAAGMPCKTVFKVNEGRPNATDLLKAGAVQLVVYTTTWRNAGVRRRKANPPQRAVTLSCPLHHDLERIARAAAEALASRHRDPIRVWLGSLQGIHAAAAV